jgi:transaldolase
MKPTQQLHDLGQSVWLDNITRKLLTSGTLGHYIADRSVTGLTSNPSIFDLAIKDSNCYDDAIREKKKEGKSGEVLFFELAIEDLRQASDLFRPIHDETDGMDGWVSLEVSPSLAYDAASTVKEAVHLHTQAQRLLWASTGTKDPEASDTLYIKALAAPDTINTIPEKTLLAFADHGALGELLPEDGGDAEKVISAFAKAGVDDEQLAADLQREGAASFVASWKDLLNCIESKVTTLKAAGLRVT